jgi:beta-lactamase class C
MQRVLALVLLVCSIVPSAAVRASTPVDDVETVVTQTVRPLMERYGIPGLAVGVTVDGVHSVYTYGVASKATGRRVDRDTLFEIGSISKTFTATLASYAQVTGKLALSDVVSADLPALRGTSFDRVRLVHLGTHTAGGLPLQLPDAVTTDAQALDYYRQWKPDHVAGTDRVYSNPSIMLLGLVTAARLQTGFAAAMQRDVFDPLGLRNTFLVVPANAQARYAQGYTGAGKPRRLQLGPLALEAYGVRTTAPDLLRFLDANMGLVPVRAPLRRAIIATQTGYYRTGAMTQDLIWE